MKYRCCVCRRSKPASDFYRDSRNSRGRRYECMACSKRASHSPKQQEYLRNYRKARRQTHWAHRILHNAQAHSRNSSRPPPSITVNQIKELWESQNGKCYWTGRRMKRSSKDKLQASLDRVNNSQGYKPSNCVLVCVFVNYSRRNLSPKEFVQMCQNVVGLHG